MAFLVGTDEAGYGPNLGPLVISASVWHLPEAEDEVDLYKLLAKCVQMPPLKTKPAAQRGNPRRKPRIARLALADSKVLYKAGGTLELLERGVLSLLAASGARPSTWRELCDSLDGGCHRAHAALPWLCDFDLDLPLAQSTSDIEEATQLFLQGAGAAGARCHKVRSRIVHPADFNRLTQEEGNKSTLLTAQTLDLLTEIVAELPEEPVVIVCDKHGGRNRYSHALQRAFPEYLVEVRGEGRSESRYAFGPAAQRVSVAFRTQAERYLPSAVASMTSKYVRELCMRGFNDFWQRHVPGVRPTAGYPTDAKRFKREIAARQTELGIADSLLWRAR